MSESESTPPHIYVLSRDETQRWHSPLNKSLRQWQRDRIVASAQILAQEHGRSTFVLYDCHEHYLTAGSVNPSV